MRIEAVEKRDQFSNLLENIAETLDIPESRYKEAEDRYNAVGEWLGREGSPLAPFRPEIYTQGSFKLGTAIKPVSMGDEYDIDLVCHLNILKESISPRMLKIMVGDRLKEHAKYAQMLETEGRRCWTLNYADGARFHMDILPAIPEDYQWLLRLGVPHELAQHAICITDTSQPNWLGSNPKGYHMWFMDRIKIILIENKRLLAAESKVDIEDIPDYKAKTPLQRSVQILKRHRDIVFNGDSENKPVSIIITTLAAHAYNNEANLYEALISILNGMESYIKKVDGVSWVANPVNPSENFADKWQESPEKERKFRNWLRQVKHDLENAISKTGIQRVAGALEPSFGKQVLNESLIRMGESYKDHRDKGILKMSSGSGVLGASGATKVRSHTFYGT